MSSKPLNSLFIKDTNQASIFFFPYTIFLLAWFIFSSASICLEKKPFSASKYAKDMLAYRKGTPYCFIQQTTALHEHRSKYLNMETFIEFTCQKYMKRFEACCICSQKYFF